MSKQPDRSLDYAAPSVAFQLATEIFNQMSGAELYHIPYKGSNPSLVALLSGDVDTVILDGAPLIPHMRAGAVKALAVTSPERSPLYPDLPTIAESGVPGYEMKLWMGLFAKTGTPPEIIDAVQSEIAEIMARPEVKSRLADLGIDAGGISPEETLAMILAERENFAKIIKSAGITVQ